MKLKNYLPLLLIMFLFTACVKKTVTISGVNTIQPEFSIDREDLKSRISAIILADDILITSGNTKKTGEPEFNFLNVEIVSPDDYPASGMDFSNLANEITKVVEEDITNIKEYQKLNIEVRNTLEENDTKHTRTFKKEIDL